MRADDSIQKVPLDENNCWFEFIVQVPKFAIRWNSSSPMPTKLPGITTKTKITSSPWKTRTKSRLVEMQTMLADELKRKRKQAKIDTEIARQKAEGTRAIESRGGNFLETTKTHHHVRTAHAASRRKCTVRYNKNNTNLSFAEDIYLTSGFNRWKHNNNNVPEPLKMRKPKNPKTDPFYTIEIDVPVTRGCAISSFRPVSAKARNTITEAVRITTYRPTGPRKKRPLHIINIAVEMAPIAKVGGLADVVTSLSELSQISDTTWKLWCRCIPSSTRAFIRRERI